MVVLQVGVAGARLSVDPSVLQLCEMALEETDLVFVCRTRNIGSGPLDREVVIYSAFVDSSCGLRNELRPPHVAVPLGCIVDRNLGTLLTASVPGILVVWREVYVFGGSTRSVDVVLVIWTRKRLCQ